MEYKVQNSKIPYDLFGFDGYHIFYKKVTESIKDTESLNNEKKTEKYFTFHDDLRYGDGTIFSKISYSWKRGLEYKTNLFKGSDTIRKITNSYQFLDTPYTKFSTLEPGLFLDNPTQPNEFHQRSIYATVVQTAEPNFWNFILYSSKKLISAWYYRDREVVEDFVGNKKLRTVTDFAYLNPAHAQLTSQVTTFPDSSVRQTLYKYAHDKGDQRLIDANMVGIPLETTVVSKRDSLDAGKIVSRNEVRYDNAANLLPSSSLSYDIEELNDPDITNPVPRTEVTYDSYDSRGNLLQYTTRDGKSTAIIWGYNQTQPIAKIEGAKLSDIALSQISEIVNASDYSSNNYSESNLLTKFDSFRTNLSGYTVTTYTYKPLVGVTSITPPSGIREYYFYDASNRLERVEDANHKVLKKYDYHYKTP